MQLQDEPAVEIEALVLFAAVSAPAAKQLLVPATAGFDVVNADEGSELHGD
jgi:hypothetical protein